MALVNYDLKELCRDLKAKLPRMRAEEEARVELANAFGVLPDELPPEVVEARVKELLAELPN